MNTYSTIVNDNKLFREEQHWFTYVICFWKSSRE